MERKLLYMVAGAALIALGILLPQAWYDALPTLPDAPLPPIKGVHLLQASLIFEGLVVFWLASRRWSFVRIDAPSRLRPLTGASSATESSQVPFWVVAGITALALALRLFRVNSDLWFDEIATVLDYRQVPPLQVVASYVSANNHLLNTLLVKLSIGLFGEEEWAIRLSAVLFGTATIPIMYWLARLVFPVWASASAALLLAVSYHHIFYSQNARGYAAYLFFSLLATRLLIDAVQHDRLRTWGVYIACMFLNFAALLNSVFVFVAHVLVGGGAVWAVWRRGASPVPLVRRLVAVFAIAAFLVFQLYATALPQAYVTLRMTYVQQTSGYTMSRDLLDELIRGLSAGLGVGLFLLAVPFLAVAGAGVVLLYRRQWPVALSLSAPLFLNAAVLVARKLTISPRFFLLALPLAILAVVQSLVSLAEWAGRSAHGPRRSRAMAVSLVVVAASISLLSLWQYYTVPKQPFRASIQYVQAQRRPGDVIIAVHLADKGFRFYGPAFGLIEGKDYFSVRSVEALEAVLSAHPVDRSLLVTTLTRLLRLAYPDLDGRIRKDWVVTRRFRGTVGGGDIDVWAPRTWAVPASGP